MQRMTQAARTRERERRTVERHDTLHVITVNGEQNDSVTGGERRKENGSL